MENEFRSLLGAMSGRVDGLRAMRSVQEQKDAVCGIVREAIVSSSIRCIDGGLWRYGGVGYVPVDEQSVRSCVVNVLADMGVGASCLGLINQTPWAALWRNPVSFDRGKVCFRNMAFDVERLEVLPLSPDVVSDWVLGYDFSPVAVCPMWESFLCEVLPDEGVRRCLQEFFGMCFIDRERLSVEKFAMLVGTGSNGKSVVCDVVRRVLGGDSRVDSLDPAQLQDPKQVVSLRGKVLNIAPDVRRGAAFTSALKALASSQTVKGWMIYEGGVDVKCPPLCFAMNEVPVFYDLTNAMLRRMLLFSFDVTIPRERQDRRLADRIVRAESSGVFMWMVEGARRLRENGGMFTESARMDSDLDQFFSQARVDGSPVLRFLDEHGWSVSPQFDGQVPDKVSAGFIYEGLGRTVKKTGITQELRRYGVRADRSKETRYYLYRTESYDEEKERG